MRFFGLRRRFVSSFDCIFSAQFEACNLKKKKLIIPFAFIRSAAVGASLLITWLDCKIVNHNMKVVKECSSIEF